MSEHEHSMTPEVTNQPTEAPIDVMSLKTVDMTVDDYNQYADMYPEDPRVVELLDRYGVAPGEPMIVSATDAENPGNNILRVVATGEDSFTTNRLLTNELEKQLRDVDENMERGVSADEAKEIGGHALSAVGIEEPAGTPERETGSEQALLEAKNLFDQQLEVLATEYSGNANRYKNSLKTSAETLGRVRNGLQESTDSAFGYLRSGFAQPERARQVVGLAIEELTTAYNILISAHSVTEGARAVSGSLHVHTESHQSNVARLRGEFQAGVSRAVDAEPDLDAVVLGRADTEVTEKVVSETSSASRLAEATQEIDVALRRIEETLSTSQPRIGSLLSRLEDLRAGINYGRFDTGEYEGILQSTNALVRELEEGSSIQRFAALAGEL